eukprot:4427917-Prymnesium_polylepis.1
MAASPDTCGYAELDVALTPEPLIGLITGGQTRQVGADSALSLDACGSNDADDPATTCVTTTSETTC